MIRWIAAVAGLVACLALALGVEGPAVLGRWLIAAGLPDAALAYVATPGWRGVALYRAGRYDEAAAAFWEAGPDFAFDRGDALARAGRYRDALEAFNTALALRPEDDAANLNRALMASLVVEPEGPGLGKDTDGGAATKEKKVKATANDEDGKDTLSKGDGMAGNQLANSQSSTPGGSKVSRKGHTDTKAEASGEGKATGSATDSDGVGKASVNDTAAIAKAFEMVQRREMGKSFDAQSVAPSRQWLRTIDDDPGRYLKLRIFAEHVRRIDAGIALPDEVDND